MEIEKAVITTAGRGQRTLPLQTLIDTDGVEKTVLDILVAEVLRAGVKELCVVVRPGDEISFTAEARDHLGRLQFVHQAEPRGYGHAIFCAQEFVGDAPFLHLVGDHLYISRNGVGCARRLVDIARDESSSVSAVQATRESLLPFFGAVGGRRLTDRTDLYHVDTVLEKPTPTLAERQLIVPGLRAGHYLCFFGMHVLTPTIFSILAQHIEQTAAGEPVGLSAALGELAGLEQLLALRMNDWRYDIGVKYGLMTAQIALALNGDERDRVLTLLLELLAQRQLGDQEG